MTEYRRATRAEVEERLVRAVEEFYAQVGKPYPMRALSARFTSALDGLFAEAIEDLIARGRIRVQYTPTGARVVWPATVTVI